MEGANKEGGQKEQEIGEWSREMARRMGEWEKVQRLEERVEKGAKEGERQEADRAEEIPGQKGRVEGQKGENDREQRGGGEERKKERREGG